MGGLKDYGNMNKEQENKLLAFFAANATKDDIKNHQEYKTSFDRSYSGGPFMPPYPTVSTEDAKFKYAKVMLEKYKEFCNLLDNDIIEKEVTDKCQKFENALMAIEDIFMDGENTHDDWRSMGNIAREALKGYY